MKNAGLEWRKRKILQINFKKFQKILAKCFEIVYINLRAQKTPVIWDTQFNIEFNEKHSKNFKKVVDK